MARGGDPVPLGKLLRNIVTRRGLGGSLQLQAVKEALEKALETPEFSHLQGHLRVAALRGSTLTLQSTSAPLAYELRSFHSRKLFDEMKQHAGIDFVTRLKFTAGAT